MEAWKDEPRVRPIPIEDEPSSDFGFDAPEPPRGRPRRPWLPLALAATAVVVVVGSVASFGALQDDDPIDPIALEFEAEPEPEEAPFVPEAPQLKPLQETVPGLTSRLTLIAEGPDGPVALLWDPTFAQPKDVPIAYNPEHTATVALDDARFDAGGDFVRILGRDEATNSPWMWVGTPSNTEEIDIPGVRGGAVWHANDVGQLAWIEGSAEGDWTLHTARLNPLSLEFLNESSSLPVAPGSQILRWDSSGFIINPGSAQEPVIALDDNGVEIWRTPGMAIAASETTVLVATAYSQPDPELPDGEPVVTSVTSFDRDGGQGPVIISDQPTADQVHRSVWITSSTDFLATVDVRGQSTRLGISGGTLSAVRSLRLNDDVLPLGFVDNDSYFVFASDGGNDLIFVNWRVGSIHEVLVPDQYSVVGFATG